MTIENRQITRENLEPKAVAALKASVRFGNEVVSIMELRLPLSAINASATIQTMRKRIADMTAFCDALTAPPSPQDFIPVSDHNTICVNDDCKLHGGRRHTHSDGTIHSRAVFVS